MKTILAYFGFILILFSCTEKMTHKSDVIIYGGTSGAVIAAVEIVKSGKSVIVVSLPKCLLQ